MFFGKSNLFLEPTSTKQKGLSFLQQRESLMGLDLTTDYYNSNALPTVTCHRILDMQKIHV